MNLLIYALLIFGILILIAAILSSMLSLIFEVRFWRGRSSNGLPLRNPLPSVTVIMPVRGLDQDLRNNVASVLDQDYPGPRKYVFVLDSEDDPVYGVITELLRGSGVDAEVLINRGGRSKGEALAYGLGRVVGDVVVFVDSDARVHRQWLRN
jgi:Glycosyltransferases, probably involved in cell wall biogenesis